MILDEITSKKLDKMLENLQCIPENVTKIHLHSDLSNPCTVIDSATKYNNYIDRAKELGMKAIAFTEHGSIFEWYKKKMYCEKNGLKYIHAQEFYVTETLTEKIRDNYHVCLYARNFDGFLELNELSSKGFNRKDGHFYYNPRITIDELINTSNNIIVSTACLGGILASGTPTIKDRFLKFLIRNKHRCFLEIQHHNVKKQIEYNQYLYKLSQQYNLNLITGTDTHALNQELADARIILQRAKDTFFENEEGWDLTFKSLKDLLKAYLVQNSLPIDVVCKAINNTNVLADMIEEFQLDKTAKYPKLYENSEEVFKEKIVKGYEKRILGNPLKRIKHDEYSNRVNQEFATYEKTGSIDFMLFMENVVDYAHENDMWQGYGRGSVNGSLIAYLLDITDMDSVEYKLNFFRFLNPDRISLCDIDTDWSEQDRIAIKNYLFNFKGLYTAEIITFNTIAEKGAIRDVGRALEIPLNIIDDICKNLEGSREIYKAKYPELFKYAELLNGVIVSIGTHPSGVVISPIPLDTNVGLCSVPTNENPVTMLYMKELDDLNYVKFDILGLDNIDIINRTCKLAEIERITPDNLDLDDWKVWESIREDTTCIFQWESDNAQDYITHLFSDETIARIKAKNPNISYLNLFSFGNGAIRPSGASFRNEASKGLFKDNGLKALNDFLNDTMGYLCYQEQIMMFLVLFCGYSHSESDTVRRGIAKKGGTEKFIPEIKRRFIETVSERYGTPIEVIEEIAEPFLQIILDASDYGFSQNHSDPYSIIGYGCGYLRYYYPYEFITSALNVRKTDIDKVAKITNYANKIGINIKPIQFRYSKADYMYDKETKSIYKGIQSIKYCNAQIAEELYELADNDYINFIELLEDINGKTSINSKQLEILIKLDFFREFGKSKKLLQCVSIFNLFFRRKEILKSKIQELELDEELIRSNGNETAKKYTKLNWEMILKELYLSIPDEAIGVIDLMKTEIAYLGYTNIKLDLPDSYALVINYECPFTHPMITLYYLNSGNIETIKCKKTNYNKNKFEILDILNIQEKKQERKWAVDGKDETGKPKFKQLDELEWILKNWKICKVE